MKASSISLRNYFKQIEVLATTTSESKNITLRTIIQKKNVLENYYNIVK